MPTEICGVENDLAVDWRPVTEGVLRIVFDLNMQISNLLSNDVIAVGLKAGEKEDVISRIVDLLSDSDAVADLDAVRKAVLDREKLMSTGVGKGIALPHAKSSAVSATVAALATIASPIPFDSIDEKPVQIIFLLVGAPDSQSEHIRILSRISRMMNSERFVSELLSAATPTELLEILSSKESNLSNSS